MTGASYTRWDVDVRLILDQHSQLDFYSASSQKQQSVSKFNSHTLSRFRANQFLLLLLNNEYLTEQQQITILYSLVWPNRDSNLRSTALEASLFNITSLEASMFNITSLEASMFNITSLEASMFNITLQVRFRHLLNVIKFVSDLRQVGGFLHQ
jgi:hypothetical protein